MLRKFSFILFIITAALVLTSAPALSQSENVFNIKNLPEEISISTKLVTIKKYFPQMIAEDDERSFDLYLLFLAYTQSANKTKFEVDLESTGSVLRMPEDWSKTKVRHYTIKALKKLRDRYNLIKLEFLSNKRAFVELIDVTGKNTIVMTAGFLDPAAEREFSMRFKFYLMARAILEKEGADLVTMLNSDIAKRFHVGLSDIVIGRDELQRLKGRR